MPKIKKMMGLINTAKNRKRRLRFNARNGDLIVVVTGEMGKQRRRVSQAVYPVENIVDPKNVKNILTFPESAEVKFPTRGSVISR
jgi:hypothetical protein